MATKKKKPELITIYVRVLPTLHKRIVARAEKKGVSITNVIRELLDAAA